MGNKAKGTALELGSVKKAVWGFRAPGSGGFAANNDVVPRTPDQEKVKVPLSMGHIDFGFKDNNYIVSDYVAFSADWDEVRTVEAKTVRPKKNKDGSKQNAKEVEVTTYFYLTEEHKKPGPYQGMMRKSNFCIELERTWLHAMRLRESKTSDGTPVFNVPVNAYLHVRFIGSGKELFMQIPDLLKLRTPADDVLKIVKDSENVIRVEWQKRT